jgi:hypothetical protein
MSVYTIFPKRGIVDPSQSLISLGGAQGPVSEMVFLPFDCTVSEAPEFTGVPTQSLVEDASTISDHIVLRPVRLKVDAVISDTPLKGTPFASAVSGGASVFSGSSPSQKAYDYIRNKLYLAQAVFDFVGGFQVYQNMVISEFRPVRNAETGSSLSFSMTLEQVTIVNTKVLVDPANTKAAPKQSLGGQPLKPVDQNSPIYGKVMSATGQTSGGASELAGATPTSSPALGTAFPDSKVFALQILK